MVKKSPKDPKPSKLEWKGFMSDKISDVVAGKKQRIEPPKPKFMKRIRQGTEEYHERRKLFNSTVNELKDMVMPHMDREQKLQMTNTKVRALGGRAERVKSMPYNMLKDHKLRVKEKETKRKEEEDFTGISTLVGKISANASLEVRKKNEKVKKRSQSHLVAKTFSEGRVKMRKQ